MLKKPLSTCYLILYSLLAFPLACMEIPLYIHIPKFYVEFEKISLTTLGFVLFGVRFLDALKDPLVGGWLDAQVKNVEQRIRLIIYVLPLLTLGFYLLCHPSLRSSSSPVIWLIFTLFSVQAMDGLICVTYSALGADLSADYSDRTRVAVCRESWRLYGVFFASALPTFLFQKIGVPETFHVLSLAFIALIALGGIGLLRFNNFSQKPEVALTSTPSPTKLTWRHIFSALEDRHFRWLMSIFFVNGIAISIPATLVLFFIKDVLKAENYAGYFMALYFLAGAMGMILWKKLSHRYGKKRCWKTSIAVSALIFIWTFTLGTHSYIAYGLICFFSGLSLGGDLAIPSSLVADLTERRGTELTSGSYFGLWNVVNKLSVAVAPGIILPTLAFLDYSPAQSSSSIAWLPFMYALVPCVLRGLSYLLLTWSPLDQDLTVSSNHMTARSKSSG